MPAHAEFTPGYLPSSLRHSPIHLSYILPNDSRESQVKSSLSGWVPHSQLGSHCPCSLCRHYSSLNRVWQSGSETSLGTNTLLPSTYCLYQQGLAQSRSRTAVSSVTAMDRSSKGEEDSEWTPTDQMTIQTRGDGIFLCPANANRKRDDQLRRKIILLLVTHLNHILCSRTCYPACSPPSTHV